MVFPSYFNPVHRLGYTYLLENIVVVFLYKKMETFVDILG